MEHPLLLSQLTAFLSVVLIDVVLAGDNAVVVGTAASGLSPRHRGRVLLFGVLLALVARITFALIAVDLLAFVGLMFAGGLLLLWVAWKMWREIRARSMALKLAGADGGAPGEQAAKSPGSAILQIAFADLSMSLDNVLAVAGAAREHPYIMVFGLFLSIALMGVAANYVARMIERHHWIAYLGLFLVLYVALDMIVEGGREIILAEIL